MRCTVIPAADEPAEAKAARMASQVLREGRDLCGGAARPALMSATTAASPLPATVWVPNALARSVCTAATALPSRCASAAKSPPTSSACRSPSPIRSRTLAVAIAQPSALLAKNLVSSARVVDRPPTGPKISPSGSAMCDEPAACNARCTSTSGFGPGCSNRKTLRIDESP